MENILKVDNSIVPCRGCTTENLKLEMHFLYQDPAFANNFSQLSTLQIDELDGLPTHICIDCYNQLNEFINFRKICVTSDETFRQRLLEDVKNEPFKINDNLSTIDNSQINVKIEHDDESDVENEENIDWHGEDIDDTNVKDEKLTIKRKPLKKRLRKNNDSKNTSTRKTVRRDSKRRKKYICDKCGKEFFKKHRIEGHLRQHLGLNPYACHICNISFIKFGTITLHNEVNHSKKEFMKFKCNFDGCGREYSLKNTLNAHKRAAHEGGNDVLNKPSFVCDQCGKTLSTAASLRTHIFTHTGQSAFKCTICSKQFASRHKLNIHTMRHEGVKNHVCPLCGLRKTTAQELKVHINYHTKDKVYPCKFCSAVFSNNANMARHIRIVHCGVKAYACKFCDQSFGKAETLKHHTMTHTGEKPHACTICDKRFIQSTALRTHMKTHTKSAVAAAATTKNQ